MNTSRITQFVLFGIFLLIFITACGTNEPEPVFPAPHIERATLENGTVTIIGTNLFRAEPVDAFPQDLAITVCGQALADIHVVGTTQTITLEGGKTVTITRAGTITGSMTGDPAGDSLTLTNPDGQGVTAAIECAPSPEPEPEPEPKPGALVFDIDLQYAAGTTFKLPFQANGTVTIHWGDGIVEEVAPPRSTTHEYADPGVYIITVTGDLTDVRLGHDTWSPVSSETLIKLHSWGDFAYREDGLLAAFEGAKNLVAVPDALPEGITTLEGLFNKAESFNGDISGWDVSKARNMQFMFLDASNFDQDLSDWCVRYILTEPLSFSKDAGFAGNDNFQPLWGMNCGGPDLVIEIQIPDLDGYYLLPFEATGTATIDWGNGEVETFTNPVAQPHTYFREGTYKITASGELTDVKFGARVLGFSQENLIAVHSWGHFDYATRALGQAFSGATNVTSVPDHLPPGIVFLPLAFRGAASFNGDISNWDVSEITDMERMFEDARSFNQDLSGWCVE